MKTVLVVILVFLIASAVLPFIVYRVTKVATWAYLETKRKHKERMRNGEKQKTA